MDVVTGWQLHARASVYQSQKHVVQNAFGCKICGPGDAERNDGIYLVIPHSGKLPVAYKGLAVYLIGFVVWADGDNSIQTLGERD